LLAVEANFLYSFKNDLAVLCSVECIIRSAPDVFPRKKLCAALAHQNIAGFCNLASIEFYSETL